MTQPADTHIPATVPATEPVQPESIRTPQQAVAYESFNLSSAIGAFGREVLETGECDPASLKSLVRRMAALHNAAVLAEEARPGSSDADLVSQYLRNPHRMKGVQIL